MTTYRLPPELGGGECTLDRVVGAGNTWPNHRVVKVPAPTVGAWYVLVPKDALTEVKPPLPPEPPVGSVVLDTYGHAWQRMEGEGRGDWLCTYADDGDDWQNLNEVYGPLVLLVPAPEPVTLPWRASTTPISSIRPSLEVECAIREDDGAKRVRVAARPFGDGEWFLTQATAREMARALDTAADEADRRVSDATP